MSSATLVGHEGYVATVRTSRGHTVVFDEPEDLGGTDTAPSPAAMLGAALNACTVLTLEMYAGRKGWDITGIEVDVDTEWDGPRPAAYRVTLGFPDHLDEEQVGRLKVIAGKCPVHHTLANPIPVEVI